MKEVQLNLGVDGGNVKGVRETGPKLNKNKASGGFILLRVATLTLSTYE